MDRQLVPVPRIGRRTLTDEEQAFISSIKIAHASADERFTYWFPAAYRESLGSILQSIQCMSEEKVRIFFLCAFSNILRRCSTWLSGSIKPQKDLGKVLADPVEEFRKQVHSMCRGNTLYWEDLKSQERHPEFMEQRFCITEDDVRHLSLPDKTLDLLVTSPPYATCYEYSEMHQLTQLWFEKYGVFPPQRPLHTYIGTKGLAQRSQATQQRLRPIGSSVADEALARLQDLAVGSIASDVKQEVRALRYYFQDMYDTMHQFARVIVPGKRLVLIIGDSYRRSVSIPTSRALCEMAVSRGFELERRIVRRIPGRVLVSTRDQKTGRFSSTRKSDIQAYPEEDVLIFVRRA